MERGFLGDANYGSGTFSVGRWFAGIPVKGWWGTLKVKEKDGLELAAYRCERCGLVLNFAQKP